MRVSRRELAFYKGSLEEMRVFDSDIPRKLSFAYVNLLFPFTTKDRIFICFAHHFRCLIIPTGELCNYPQGGLYIQCPARNHPGIKHHRHHKHGLFISCFFKFRDEAIAHCFVLIVSTFFVFCLLCPAEPASR
jgi:hypothetical protein